MKKDFIAYLKFFRDNNRYTYIQDKKLLPQTIIEKIDYFRKMRNLIHINALLSHSLEDTYRELDSAFLYTKEIFDCIEERCNEIG